MLRGPGGALQLQRKRSAHPWLPAAAAAAAHSSCLHADSQGVSLQPACSTSSDMLAAFDEGDCLHSADAPDAATTGMYGSMDISSSFDGFDSGHEAGKDKR